MARCRGEFSEETQQRIKKEQQELRTHTPVQCITHRERARRTPAPLTERKAPRWYSLAGWIRRPRSQRNSDVKPA
jgi:hypothetical protein